MFYNDCKVSKGGVIIIELAQKLNLSPTLIESLEELLLKEESKVIRFSKKCISDGFYHLIGKSPLFALAVILKLAVDVKAKYDDLGIDEKIYYDTMSDIKLWCEKNDNKGLKNYKWLRRHVQFEIFRLGRLQFEFYKCKDRSLYYPKLPFKYGEKLLFVHIPEDKRLDSEACLKSFEEAEEFFEKFFPEYKYSYFFCLSWLLYEGNRDFMESNSNIVKFMSLFNHCYSVKIDVLPIERIYGKRKLFKKSYSENTSLQRSAKEYMLKGNMLGFGVGVRKPVRSNDHE